MIKPYAGPRWRKNTTIPPEFTEYIDRCLELDPAVPYLHLDQINDLPMGTCGRQARILGLRRLTMRRVGSVYEADTPSEKASHAPVTASKPDLRARAAELVLERLKDAPASEATAWIEAIGALS